MKVIRFILAAMLFVVLILIVLIGSAVLGLVMWMQCALRGRMMGSGKWSN